MFLTEFSAPGGPTPCPVPHEPCTEFEPERGFLPWLYDHMFLIVLLLAAVLAWIVFEAIDSVLQLWPPL